jgi:hypothetical protein
VVGRALLQAQVGWPPSRPVHLLSAAASACKCRFAGFSNTAVTGERSFESVSDRHRCRPLVGCLASDLPAACQPGLQAHRVAVLLVASDTTATHLTCLSPSFRQINSVILLSSADYCVICVLRLIRNQQSQVRGRLLAEQFVPPAYLKAQLHALNACMSCGVVRACTSYRQVHHECRVINSPADGGKAQLQ